MTTYNFDLKLGDRVQIDTEALYGYWKRTDGSEGGGLWFERVIVEGARFPVLSLYDYDGASELPKAIYQSLRDGGVIVDSSFD